MDVPNELKTLLSCSLCGRNYDLSLLLPKILDCKHVFCVECIEGSFIKIQHLDMVICPQCKRPTKVGTYPESLVFLLRQMPALKLGRALIMNYEAQQQQPEANGEDWQNGTYGRANWLDLICVENFLMNSSTEHCLIHAMPNTIWCHNCQILMCPACADMQFHYGHRFTRQLNFSELLRQLFSNELARIGKISDQATQIAGREMALWQQLHEACSLIQLHIKRELLEHHPTIISCQMRGWRERTQRALLLNNGQFSTTEMVRLLAQLNEQKRKFQHQLNELQYQYRLKSVISENGLELLDFKQLNERVLDLREGTFSNGTEASVETPPALLLTNYCIYSYWRDLQSQYLPTAPTSQQTQPNTELVPQHRMAVVTPNINQCRLECEALRQLMLEQQLIEREVQNHDRNYTCWGDSNADQLSSEGSNSSSPISTASSSQSNSGAQVFDYGNYNRLKRRTNQRFFNSPYWALEMEQAMENLRKSTSTLNEPSTSAAAAAVAAATVPATATPLNVASAEENRIVPLITSNLQLHKFPIYFLDMEIAGKFAGRILIEVHKDVAPRMAENFRILILHERGFGYRGCPIFQAWGNESIITGDFECHNGRGGYAAFEKAAYFLPDNTRLAPLRGAIGMRRSQRLHDNNTYVGSQFRLILTEIRAFTAIFGYIVDGIEVADRISETGDIIGRPGVRTVIKNCGIYRRK